MTDNRTTELRAKLTEHGIEYETNDHMGVCETSWNGFTAMQLTPGAKLMMAFTPEQAIAATLGDEAPKKCSTCQYRYVVGQRPYPTFGYMCGFGDGKKLCGGNTSVLDHMSCEHWEKELR